MLAQDLWLSVCEFHGKSQSLNKFVYFYELTAVESAEHESKRKERSSLPDTVKLSNAEEVKEFECAIRILSGEEPLPQGLDDNAKLDAEDDASSQIDTNVVHFSKLSDTVNALNPVFKQAMTAPALQGLKDSDMMFRKL